MNKNITEEEFIKLLHITRDMDDKKLNNECIGKLRDLPNPNRFIKIIRDNLTKIHKDILESVSDKININIFIGNVGYSKKMSKINVSYYFNILKEYPQECLMFLRSDFIQELIMNKEYQIISKYAYDIGYIMDYSEEYIRNLVNYLKTVSNNPTEKMIGIINEIGNKVSISISKKDLYEILYREDILLNFSCIREVYVFEMQRQEEVSNNIKLETFKILTSNFNGNLLKFFYSLIELETPQSLKEILNIDSKITEGILYNLREYTSTSFSYYILLDLIYSNSKCSCKEFLINNDYSDGTQLINLYYDFLISNKYIQTYKNYFIENSDIFKISHMVFIHKSLYTSDRLLLLNKSLFTGRFCKEFITEEDVNLLVDSINNIYLAKVIFNYTTFTNAMQIITLMDYLADINWKYLQVCDIKIIEELISLINKKYSEDRSNAILKDLLLSLLYTRVIPIKLSEYDKLLKVAFKGNYFSYITVIDIINSKKFKLEEDNNDIMARMTKLLIHDIIYNDNHYILKRYKSPNSLNFIIGHYFTDINSCRFLFYDFAKYLLYNSYSIILFNLSNIFIPISIDDIKDLKRVNIDCNRDDDLLMLKISNLLTDIISEKEQRTI